MIFYSKGYYLRLILMSYCDQIGYINCSDPQFENKESDTVIRLDITSVFKGICNRLFFQYGSVSLIELNHAHS